ncbi:MAG: bacteriohemerythrin [Pseudodesulfovibrio sp.]
MALIEWTNALSVGFIEIDKDHEKLVGILNQLNDEIEQKCDRDEIEDTLEELIDYTSWHFRHEERLMQQEGYSDMVQHQQAHSSLAAEAVEIQIKYDNGDDAVLDVLMPFLKDWLTDHILVTDKALAEYLSERD